MSTSIELLKEAALELTRLQMKCDDTGSANPIIDKVHHRLSTNGWQTIESAPKDGTRILILCPQNRITCAKYDTLPMVGKGWFVSVPCCSGWGEGSDTYIHWKEDQPTHWQPLPPPPVK